jgi:hypothetical protein
MGILLIFNFSSLFVFRFLPHVLSQTLQKGLNLSNAAYYLCYFSLAICPFSSAFIKYIHTVDNAKGFVLILPAFYSIYLFLYIKIAFVQLGDCAAEKAKEIILIVFFTFQYFFKALL